MTTDFLTTQRSEENKKMINQKCRDARVNSTNQHYTKNQRGSNENMHIRSQFLLKTMADKGGEGEGDNNGCYNNKRKKKNQDEEKVRMQRRKQGEKEEN